jgi:hypothetical protein
MLISESTTRRMIDTDVLPSVFDQERWLATFAQRIADKTELILAELCKGDPGKQTLARVIHSSTKALEGDTVNGAVEMGEWLQVKMAHAEIFRARVPDVIAAWFDQSKIDHRFDAACQELASAVFLAISGKKLLVYCKVYPPTLESGIIFAYAKSASINIRLVMTYDPDTLAQMFHIDTLFGVA